MTAALSQSRRLMPPAVPSGRVTVLPPPEITASDGVGGLLSSLMPMLGSVGSIVFIAMADTGGKGMIAGGMFLVASLGFVVVNGWRQRSQRQGAVVGARREYLAYLADLRDTVRQAAQAQRAARSGTAPTRQPWRPSPRSAPGCGSASPTTATSCTSGYGRSDQPLCLTLDPPETAPLAQLDPVAASAAHRLMVTHEIQPDLPLAVDLRSAARVEVTGTEAQARALARAIICPAATFHSPEHLADRGPRRATVMSQWDWVKWLPHAQSTRAARRRRPGADGRHVARRPRGAAARRAPRPAPLRPGEHPATPHVLLVVDGGDVPPGNPVLTARRGARRHRPRPARPVGRAERPGHRCA